MGINLRDFLKGYAEGIAWANTYVPSFDNPSEYVVQGDGGPEAHAEQEPDGTWSVVLGDEDYASPRQPIDLTDARAFYANESANMWATGNSDFEQHGYDFAMTRNHHGVGFWDRDYRKEVGQALTDAAHLYGEASITF